jgi:hypothetical protein
MILTSLLLAAATFNPAMMPRGAAATPTEGFIRSDIVPDATCKPGGICASKTLNGNWNHCFFANFWNKSAGGGTPLTIDVTDTDGQGSPVYVYWVNATNRNIGISGNAMAKYFCV